MSTSVVLKLLGRDIDFAALQNKAYGLWRPSQPFQLMDIENGYFLAKFQNSDDSEMVLSQEVLWKFGGMVGKVTKLDFNTNSETKGRYVRMAVYVNLEKPLLSQVLINGIFSVLSMKAYQRCASRVGVGSPRKTVPMTGTCHAVTATTTGTGEFGPWMLVERKTRRNPCEDRKIGKFESGEKSSRSRFHALILK
ncbi:hypothetical protein J1N35_024603 [Gossypium stocksii]|uniref:DUF4283 domain-containing protein n=1 Tax=Gossypium stocksii TaxID=47602 RepID=A0A9D3V5G8_9ROSI|nr:hypothetical protein J1N35_024603 [Gossypium stocksii]